MRIFQTLLFCLWPIVSAPAATIMVRGPVKASAAGAATFTYVNSNSVDGGTNSGSSTTATVAVTGVQAGDIVVVHATNMSAATMTCSDGTSSLTGLTRHDGPSSGSCQFFYILSSVASGTVTYTVTYGSSAIYRGVAAYVYTPSAAASFDVQFSAGYDGYGDTAFATGPITTTGTTELIFAGGQESAGIRTMSNAQINSVAADHGFYTTNSSFVRYFTSAPGSSSATGTWSASTNHGETMCSFKIP